MLRAVLVLQVVVWAHQTDCLRTGCSRTDWVVLRVLAQALRAEGHHQAAWHLRAAFVRALFLRHQRVAEQEHQVPARWLGRCLA